ncbi:hypothetical protein QA645_07205 [Bradyrhizobium sp. CIAT3101]|uniref:hypothetical protein n=1 Tax=Bradyrhizobium sp. CIAT3101 TaxID=439387 RepID=UPI0024B24E2E|nr:hypothetical protein [Bradyrhizobium sp. CIAT3101]WFU82522.1 hypothetical protein QA645_07205 [Bradyrhizobium sp. CIAT3101]
MDTVQIVLALLLLLLVGGVAYYLSQHRPQALRPAPATRRHADLGRQSDIQRDFQRVFSMTSAQGKEGLIKRWMDRTGCDRTEAMRLATEEWRRDNR